ncbi:MAG: hypothetical protein GF421_08765 [Candidatus Aminicenantes bacterium]|nr:hypothetical protein [Candidatus Aminicenantes bacterium]
MQIEKVIPIAEKEMIIGSSTFFYEESRKPGFFTSQDCCRCEAQGMKLWFFTANALQQSRCGEMGSPSRSKMTIKIENKNRENDQRIVIEKVIPIAEKEMIIGSSTFFYEESRTGKIDQKRSP